jgi:hypothetical protein
VAEVREGVAGKRAETSDPDEAVGSCHPSKTREGLGGLNPANAKVGQPDLLDAKKNKTALLRVKRFYVTSPFMEPARVSEISPRMDLTRPGST